MTAINKNRQKVSFYQWKLGQYENQTRRAETRTKIQLGGLVFKSGLTDYLNICAGDDLQLDANKWDDTAVILGILLEGYEQVLHDKHHDKLNHWKLLGTQAMKYNHAMIERPED
jgi:Conjugal transfer protein TraD